MASLKEVKNRISSVKSTRQITSAMKMVASAKLHKAQGQIENMLPYQQKLNDLLTNFLRTDVTFESPYTDARPVSKAAIVVLSSNGSMCGAYNANVIKRFGQVADSYLHPADGTHALSTDELFVYPIGKKIEETVSKTGYAVQGSYQALADKPAYAGACELATELMRRFAAREFDRVVLVYHHFKSMGTQVLTCEQYLPIDLTRQPEAEAPSRMADYLVEPSVESLLADLMPKVLCQKIYTVLLDASASEHAARMLAMQTATDNANDLIQDLTKQYNKSRQQAITNELLDIIGGSLK